MKKRHFKQVIAAALAAGMALSLTACGGKDSVELNSGELQEVDLADRYDQLPGKHGIQSE